MINQLDELLKIVIFENQKLCTDVEDITSQLKCSGQYLEVTNVSFCIYGYKGDRSLRLLKYLFCTNSKLHFP